MTGHTVLEVLCKARRNPELSAALPKAALKTLKRLTQHLRCIYHSADVLAAASVHVCCALDPSLLSSQARRDPPASGADQGLCHASRRRNQRELKEALLNKVPACLQESEFPCWRWQEYDKAFACVSAQPPEISESMHIA